MVCLIVKVTEECTSNCIYCEGILEKHGVSPMSLQTAACLLKRVDEYLAAHGEEHVEILWHGGEPLLCGSDFFSQVHAMQERLCAGTRTRIRHGIQTNLNRFDPSFLDPFARLGIASIGTSFDPEPHVRGPGPRIDSDAYDRLFMSGLMVLERNQIPWSLIYVVTSRSLKAPLEVFWSLTNLQLAGSITLNPVIVHDNRLSDIAVSPAGFADFLCTILPVWWEHRDRYPGVGPHSQVARGILEKRFPIEGLNFGACGASLRHLEVEGDGRIYSIGLPEMGGHQLCGSIADSQVDDALRTNQTLEIQRRLGALEDARCTRCPIGRQCHGDSPHESACEDNAFVLPSEWCEARTLFVQGVSRITEAAGGL